MTPQSVPGMFRSAGRLAVGRDHILNLLEIVLDPLVLALSQWAVAVAVEGRLAPKDIILSLIVFSLTFPGPARLTMPPWRAIRHITLGWLTLSALLFLFGYASHYITEFDPDFLLTWWWVALVSLIGAHFLLHAAAPWVRELQGPPRCAVLAGINEQGLELARRLEKDLYSNVRILGFFDDRERLRDFDEYPLLGKLADMPAYVKQHRVAVSYLSLPMASQQRILNLLDGLRDTTGSIYFAPDTFVTDLIQGRMDSVGGVPVVAVCETPFTGINGIIKRGSDIVLSLLILALISPFLLIIALCVKLTSPGPVIFKQRRYGLDGSEITVYKFRSMTVMDDGDVITQAQKHDPRMTPIGAFLRKTSLDELPQFFNVLQGRMSIVGPRPHAVAHNEMYRKLIKGYMLRHKVAPGITGWAQINGYRGETDTLEKMKGRIDHDLEYLRNWSLRLDLYIVAKTIWVVLDRENAH
ncbi:MAG: undecaprenyl-phosphate glucose phosphotransferase [Burkholderiales bacterium]